MFDEYQHLAHNLFEGFTGIKAEVKGWSADSPQTLEVTLDLDPFVFLQELDGSTLGQSDAQSFQLDTLTLLSVAGQSWTFRGEFSSHKNAADLFNVADDSCWHPDNFTTFQRAAFDHVCRFLDALYDGLCEDWDSIGEAVYKVNESEVLALPTALTLPPRAEALELVLKKGSNYWEHVPVSDLCDERYFEYGAIAEGSMFGGELHLSVTDEDGVTLADLTTDGVVLWIDEAELAAFVEKMIADHGGLEQYIPVLKEAA